MTPERYRRLQSLFDECIALPVADRVPHACASVTDDESLRDNLVGLLNAHQDPYFLSEPAKAPDTLLTQPEVTDTRSFEQIGNYAILRELGRGGMGIVYLAVRSDDAFRKVVALKLLSAGLPQDVVEHFKQERQILAGLDHPNIARILDGGTTPDGRPYYVMEYVDGQPIDAFCDKVRAGVRERVQVFLQVCSAVDYLHSQAVVHRDLKPSNILVGPEGQAKLLDFGIARLQTPIGSGSSRPGQPTLLMTPSFASPEQIEGREATKSSDVYSLGVILYKLLTGAVPFTDAEGASDLRAKLTGAMPVPPSRKKHDLDSRAGESALEFRRKVQGDLDSIVLKALTADSSRRYGSVELLARDLECYLADRPISAKADRVGYRSYKFVRRNRIAAAIVGLLTIAALLAGCFGIYLWIENTRLEAKLNGIGSYIGLLETRVGRWDVKDKPASDTEKIADLRGIRRILSSDIPQLDVRSITKQDPAKELIARIVRLLDRADRLSPGRTAVRREVAEAYREAGDLQANPNLPHLSDRQQAVVRYQRSADILDSLAQADPAWVEAQLSQLSYKLLQLGVRFQNRSNRAAVSMSSANSEAGRRERDGVSGLSSKSSQLTVFPPTGLVGLEREAMTTSEIESRLAKDKALADRARLNLAELQNRLSGRQQVVHQNTIERMAWMEAFLTQADAAFTKGDLGEAQDRLERTEDLLKTIFETVGR